MREIDIRRVFHRLHKIVAGGGAAVVTLEIELHAFLEIRFAKQRMQHADDFGTLFIHGQRIEVIHLNDHVRANRVRHRACVFGELHRAHGTHVADAVNRAGAEIGAEFLIAKDGQPLFQAQLEPVAAGDAVAGPVVEIFVADNALNVEIVFIGRGFSARQHEFGVKDVKPFVLHRAHVEEIDRDYHINVEIVLQTKALFVPLHGVFQRGHRPAGAVQVTAIYIKLQRHVAA